LKKCLIWLAFLLFLIPATASENSVTLGGEEIRKAFEGNTVSGRYTNGGFFTEYHQDDGKSLGHNGYSANVDACWAILTDSICYYYGPLEKRTTHCFTVTRNDRLYVLRVLGSSRINAVVTIEPGNPRKHDENGQPWVCDGLVSQAPAISRRALAKR
ncbi:MAG: hypothetical protein ACRCWO_08825, partial [Bosea sp. (in: a-proteobacteria)]